MTILGSLTNSLGLTGTSQSTNTAGISADEALQLKVKDAYYRMQLEKQAQAAQQAYSTMHTTSAAHTTAINPYLTQQAYQTPIDIPKYNLEEGAWDVPISQLVDLWTVRYGSKWVDESDLDEFYKVASRRLRVLNKVESHFVNGKDVFRIVE